MPEIRQHRKVAGEHDGIAVGCLIDDEQLLSGNLLPVPNRPAPRNFRLAKVAPKPAIFIALPTPLEVAEEE